MPNRAKSGSGTAHRFDYCGLCGQDLEGDLEFDTGICNQCGNAEVYV